MFEYDEKLKLRTLDAWGFAVENLELDKIAHVPMHQYRVATHEQPMLYVDNLQCCIGLYAYSNNFGFAAHINPKVMRGDEYELDDNGIAIRLRRIDDLRNIILEKYPFLEPISIGISIGCTPLSEDYPTVKMIHKSIDNLIIELNSMGIEAEKLEDQYASEFILDTENREMILAKNSTKSKR